jgi:hypothetical protein
MKMCLYRILAKLSIAFLKWEKKGLLSRNAENQKYLRDIDEQCDGGLFMHDGMVADYIEARNALRAGELELNNLQLKIELLEIELIQLDKPA